MMYRLAFLSIIKGISFWFQDLAAKFYILVEYTPII